MVKTDFHKIIYMFVLFSIHVSCMCLYIVESLSLILTKLLDMNLDVKKMSQKRCVYCALCM